jgi:hypothetical protein
MTPDASKFNIFGKAEPNLRVYIAALAIALLEPDAATKRIVGVEGESKEEQYSNTLLEFLTDYRERHKSNQGLVEVMHSFSTLSRMLREPNDDGDGSDADIPGVRDDEEEGHEEDSKNAKKVERYGLKEFKQLVGQLQRLCERQREEGRVGTPEQERLDKFEAQLAEMEEGRRNKARTGGVR